MSGAKTAPVEKMAIPTKTYTTEGLQLMVDGQTATVNHPPRAHTDTDSYVYFPRANVIATDDTVSTGERDVTIDEGNVGSINGMISAVGVEVRVATDQMNLVARQTGLR